VFVFMAKFRTVKKSSAKRGYRTRTVWRKRKKKTLKSPYFAEKKSLTSPYLENRFLEVAKTKEDSKNISIFLSIRLQMRREISKKKFFSKFGDLKKRGGNVSTEYSLLLFPILAKSHRTKKTLCLTHCSCG
jgi:hypothetical protein